MLDYDILLKKKFLEKHHKSSIKIVELPVYQDEENFKIHKKLKKK